MKDGNLVVQGRILLAEPSPTASTFRFSSSSAVIVLVQKVRGSRLDKHALAQVLDNIREVYVVDPARAQAIIAEHSNALKSGRMRSFAVKYEAAV